MKFNPIVKYPNLMLIIYCCFSFLISLFNWFGTICWKMLSICLGIALVPLSTSADHIHVGLLMEFIWFHWDNTYTLCCLTLIHSSQMWPLEDITPVFSLVVFSSASSSFFTQMHWWEFNWTLMEKPSDHCIFLSVQLSLYTLLLGTQPMDSDCLHLHKHITVS